VHPERRIEDRVAGRPAHPAGAGRVKGGARPRPEIRERGIVIPVRQIGHEPVPGHRPERRGLRQPAQTPPRPDRHVAVVIRGERIGSDHRRIAGICRGEADLAPTGRTAGLGAEQVPRLPVHARAPGRAGETGLAEIGHRVAVGQQIGMDHPDIGPDEAAELVDRHAGRAVSRQQVARTSREPSRPAPQTIVQGRFRRPQHMRDPKVILHPPADLGQRMAQVEPVALEQTGGTDPRQLQELRRLLCAGKQHHLAARMGNAGPVPGSGAHTDRAPLVRLDPLHEGIREQPQVGPLERRVQVRIRRRPTPATPHGAVQGARPSLSPVLRPPGTGQPICRAAARRWRAKGASGR